MKNKSPDSATQNAISLSSFQLNLTLLLRDPSHMNVIAYRYLNERKKAGQAFAVKTSEHKTQLEQEWNIFVNAKNGYAPSEALIAAVADRLHALLLIEFSRLKASGEAATYDTDRVCALLYKRWASVVDYFHLSQYYPLIRLTSMCLTCDEKHAVDIVWNDAGRDAALPHARTVRQSSWESRFHEVAASARLVSEQMVGV